MRCSAFHPNEMAIDWKQVIFNMLTIKGIYGREMYETWYKMTVMLESGLDIKPVITHRFAWNEFEKGFAAMKSGNSGKVILDWREAALRCWEQTHMFEPRKHSTRRSFRKFAKPACINPERILAGPQNARVDLPGKTAVLNLCANNYLGLADHPEVVGAAHEALDRWGYGLRQSALSAARRRYISNSSNG